jgi:hypothetical protein
MNCSVRKVSKISSVAASPNMRDRKRKVLFDYHPRRMFMEIYLKENEKLIWAIMETVDPDATADCPSGI